MADGSISGGIVGHSVEMSGKGKIYGVARLDNGTAVVPVRRRVDLYRHSEFGQTEGLVASTISRESDGYYEFLWLGIRPGAYDYRVVLRDWPPSASAREAKIADWVQPAPM